MTTQHASHCDIQSSRCQPPRVLFAGIVIIASVCAAAQPAGAQSSGATTSPPGRLVDLGGYSLHLWCTGPRNGHAPTVVLSIGGGRFAADWSLVQQPLSDSARVCSYDRAGFGWSDAGPTPRTFVQEAFELHSALEKSGEGPPYLLVGQSLGAWVVRRFADAYPRVVSALVLVEPGNENGYLGYKGQWVIPRTLASARPVPAARSFGESPPTPSAAAGTDQCRTGGERRVRLWNCFLPHDDYFAEEMAAFYSGSTGGSHPLGDVPLVVIEGTRPRSPPPGLTEAQLSADSVRLDLSQLSSHGRLVSDPLSGHHVQQDNPMLIVKVIRELMRE
jgi:pimeloyl-ACP methyl ester carboxylesterase